MVIRFLSAAYGGKNIVFSQLPELKFWLRPSPCLFNHSVKQKGIKKN